MTKKTKPADETPVAEESPTTRFMQLSDPPLAPVDRATWPAEELLIGLEMRCMNGGSVGLDDIRAVLAKLRG